jgi:leader peptidase (prepilin peptidase)/N-methyltransferase
VAAAFIDLEHMLLPDEITVGGAVLGLVSVPLREPLSFLDSLLGAGLGFVMVWLPFDLLYRLWRGRAGVGSGDAKLLMLAGAWFGWSGALFVLLAGAVQGTAFAIALLAVRGRIDEPEAVKLEREQLRREIEAAQGEQRRQLERERDRDPIGHEPEPGIGKARLPFGPFLALASLEYLLLGELLVQSYLGWVWG